jgi:hypothetical protein
MRHFSALRSPNFQKRRRAWRQEEEFWEPDIAGSSFLLEKINLAAKSEGACVSNTISLLFFWESRSTEGKEEPLTKQRAASCWWWSEYAAFSLLQRTTFLD